MENKDQNLGDFFRKKLRQTEPPSSGWDRPDSEVREQLLGSLPTPVVSPAWALTKLLPLLGKALIGLFLLGAGVYIFVLRSELQELKGELKKVENEEKLEERIQTESGEIPVAGENNIQETKASKFSTDTYTGPEAKGEKQGLERQDLKIQGNTSEITGKSAVSSIAPTAAFSPPQKPGIANSDLVSQVENSAASVPQSSRSRQAQASDALGPRPSRSREIPLAEYSKLTKAPTPAPPPIQWQAFSLLKNDPLLEAEKPAPALPMSPKFTPIKRADTKMKRWEAGALFSQQSISLPFQRKFRRQRTIAENQESDRLSASFHGGAITYSLNHRLHLRSGLMLGTARQRQTKRFGIAYDPTDERPLPDGRTTNEVVLDTRVGDAEVRSAMLLTFEKGEELAEGDLLELTLSETRAFALWQIPLGLDYYIYDLGSLKWMVQGGIQWTKLEFRSNQFATRAIHDRREIEVEEKRVDAGRKKAFTQWNAYAGFGLDYAFTESWRGQAMVQMNIPLSQNFTTGASQTSMTGTALSLGLSYRF